jgi:hypothetical protein
MRLPTNFPQNSLPFHSHFPLPCSSRGQSAPSVLDSTPFSNSPELHNHVLEISHPPNSLTPRVFPPISTFPAPTTADTGYFLYLHTSFPASVATLRIPPSSLATHSLAVHSALRRRTACALSQETALFSTHQSWSNVNTIRKKQPRRFPPTAGCCRVWPVQGQAEINNSALRWSGREGLRCRRWKAMSRNRPRRGQRWK